MRQLFCRRSRLINAVELATARAVQLRKLVAVRRRRNSLVKANVFSGKRRKPIPHLRRHSHSGKVYERCLV